MLKKTVKEMKNMWKYAMLLVAAAGCFACEDPEVGEALPDYYSKTFVTVQTSGTSDLIEAEVVNTPIGVVPREGYNRQVVIGLTKKLDKDLTVELGADYSLVADRVAADGVDYKQLPAEACVASSTSVVIPAGEREVVVDLALGDTSFASDVQSKDSYIMPLVITKVSDPSITISKQKQAAYCCVNVAYSMLRNISSAGEIVGMSLAPAGWTQEGGNNNIIDGSLSTYWRTPQKDGNTSTIDLGNVHYLTGLYMYGDGFDIDIEYSADGTSWLSAGYVDTESGFATGRYTYAAFYGAIEARYLRLTFNARSTYSYYWYIYEVGLFGSEFLEPYVYASTTEGNNEVHATVIHQPASSVVSVSGTLSAHVSAPDAAGYTAKFTVDNSLVDTYNAAHGTSYKPLPDGMLNIPDATIASMAYGTEEITPELTGDLASLTESAYIVPLRVSAGDLKVSVASGVVYLIITTEYNDFMPSPTNNDIRGALISDRSAFKATNASGAEVKNLFDGSTTTYSSGTYVVVDMGATYNVSALRMYYRYASSTYGPIRMRISTSSDGADWTVRGTVNSQYWYYSSYEYLLVLASSVQCQYIRLELLEYKYYNYLSEFNVYAE